jgi:hypothetical protein
LLLQAIEAHDLCLAGINRNCVGSLIDGLAPRIKTATRRSAKINRHHPEVKIFFKLMYQTQNSHTNLHKTYNTQGCFSSFSLPHRSLNPVKKIPHLIKHLHQQPNFVNPPTYSLYLPSHSQSISQELTADEFLFKHFANKR